MSNKEPDIWIDERERVQPMDIHERLILTIFRFMRKHHELIIGFFFGMIITILLLR